MTEAEWLTGQDARKLLHGLRGLASERKLRLFVCAFWRWWWFKQAEAHPDGEPDSEIILLLNGTERWAEDGFPPKGSSSFGFGFKWHPLNARSAFDGANWTIRQTSGSKSRLDCRRRDARKEADAADRQTLLLRDIFGNPFHSVTVDLAWLAWSAGTTPHIAQAIYDERGFERMPILADALEDAGCDSADILNHCRSEGPHVRGCWVVDLLLGKQ